MKCFQHNQQDSHGICKTCYKSVCSQCVIHTDDGIVCCETCRQKLYDISRYIEKNKQITQQFFPKKLGKMPLALEVFNVILGFIFLYLAFLLEKANVSSKIDSFTWVYLCLGLTFIFFAIYRYFVRQKNK